MDNDRRIIAAAELGLIFPAVLFMTAVVTRRLQPLQYEPAYTAQQIVTWYASRHWTLWVLLIGWPFTALLAGGVTLVRNWSRSLGSELADRQPSAAIPADLAMGVIAVATLSAGAVLVVVVLHMLAN